MLPVYTFRTTATVLGDLSIEEGVRRHFATLCETADLPSFKLKKTKNNPQTLEIEVSAQNGTALLKGVIAVLDEAHRPQDRSCIEVEITLSEKLSDWIYEQRAKTRGDNYPELHTTRVENLKGLRKKFHIFRIFGFVFLSYLIISAALLVGSVFTDNEKVRKYGRPSFLGFTLIFLGLLIAFSVATFCFKKEAKKASTELEKMRLELLSEELSLEEIILYSKQYVQVGDVSLLANSDASSKIENVAPEEVQEFAVRHSIK